MRATLVFNLPEEREEHTYALKGATYYCALEDIRNEFRSYRKYKELTAEQNELMQEFEQKFFELTQGVWDV